MNQKSLGCVFLLAGLLPGCATIIEGTGQSFAVATTPPGASCVVDRKGDRLGMIAPTPGSLRLEKSKNDLTVTCSKDGYVPVTTSQSPKFVGTTFGNIIAGGLIGVIVDASTGANYVYPGELKMEMERTAPSVPIASVPSQIVPVSTYRPLTSPNPFVLAPL